MDIDDRRAVARSHVQAAAWRAHLAETRAEDSEGFSQWLAASPENRAAWERMQAPWELLTEQANAPELIELRRAALSKVRAANRRRSQQFMSVFSRPRTALAAGFVLLAIGFAAFWMLHRPDVYSTGPGERRVVALPDGSRLTLDARTEVRVAYSDHVRELRLVQGQARFDVAPDIERPFTVHAQDRRILATGTAFNVDRLNTRTLITLIEGRVVVLGAAADQRVELKPGEQLIVSRDAAPLVRPVSIDLITAWQSGQLIFENEPLSAVVERVNRYSERAIEIADAKTAALKVTGVFNSGDISSFVTTATGYLPIEATRARNGNIRLSYR